MLSVSMWIGHSLRNFPVQGRVRFHDVRVQSAIRGVGGVSVPGAFDGHDGQRQLVKCILNELGRTDQPV